MSDSDVEVSRSDTEIEQRLRSIVREAINQGEQITANQVRSQAEEELGLDAGFLKSDAWKSRSRDLINAAVDAPSSPEIAKRTASKGEPTVRAGTKRKSGEAHAQRKKQKSVASEDEDSDVQLSEDSEEEPVTKAVSKAARGRKTVKSDDSGDELETSNQFATKAAHLDDEDESELSDPPKTSTEPEQARTNGNAAPDDSDDFSDVIDEPAPKKRRQSKSAPTKSKAKTKAPSKATKAKAASKDISPDEEEIKRLQGWLLKCGIRKVWGKELKKFDTSRDKIRHLRKLLEDVGMTGRFSAEKAKQIKEQRELAAELEETKAFNEQWGDGGGDTSGKEDDPPEPPRRRLKPKGLVDFGDSGDDDSG